MLRVHFIQHWFNLADMACEEALPACAASLASPCDASRFPIPRPSRSFASASQKQLIVCKVPKAKEFTNQRARFKGFVDEAVHAKNRSKSRIRARVKHVFGVVMRLWGRSSRGVAAGTALIRQAMDS
jgi:hypothetical protein